ncbi:hypothetical protein CHS0354_035823 [Potamilus streckersoni]|uniref:Uncharacterized protein n=1 Tax=Potamilus streckersoni TaxID=2493646 RepID=A0AAE0SXG4_9BIVA|nr:hypothetical protein CHS0354_035823 [Potamilus streckersoni]
MIANTDLPRKLSVTCGNVSAQCNISEQDTKLVVLHLDNIDHSHLIKEQVWSGITSQGTHGNTQ